MNKVKKIGIALTALVCITVVLNWELVSYGIAQGKGQLDIVMNAKPISECLQDPLVSDSVKSKLRLVQEIKKYCSDSLLLESGGGYEKLFDQKGKTGMWVVTGAEAFSLKSYEWSVPVLGTFTYKGFFDKKKAVNFKAELVSKRYDADISKVNAWSTLGWFKDPVMSSMLKHSEGRLARVLIHEITHFNIFVKNDITYNENLASFIGNIGAQKFLKDKFGANSKELTALNVFLEDMELFTDYMITESKELELFYSNIPNVDTLSMKNMKSRKIKSIILGLCDLPFQNTKLPDHIVGQLDQINNTFFTDFLTYKKQSKSMLIDFENNHNSSVNSYIEQQKKQHGI